MLFSPEHLDFVIETLEGIVDGVMSVGDSGMVGRARELTALSQYLSQAQAQFADNSLVEQLLEALGNGNRLVQSGGFSTPAELFDAIEELGESLPIEEVGIGVREFIMGIAHTVAGASGGGFFGRGDKISADEEDFLALLRDHLGL